MSEEKDQIEVRLDDEDAEKSSKSEPKSQEIEVSDPDDGINDLKNRLENERQARKEAERRAQDAINRQYAAQNEVEDTHLHLVRSAIDTVNNNSATLKYHYKEAMSVGDYDRAAELQEEMAKNSARLMELERGKQALENKPRQEPPRIDPVEALAAQLSPRSAEWIRKNPQYAQDQRLFNKMLSAHNLVVSDGYSPDTDDYFSAVEDILKINRKPRVEESDVEEDAMSSAAKAVQRRAAPAAAPVSRSGSGTGERKNVIKLSKDEAETARDIGMSHEQYARNKALLKKEGRLN